MTTAPNVENDRSTYHHAIECKSSIYLNAELGKQVSRSFVLIFGILCTSLLVSVYSIFGLHVLPYAIAAITILLFGLTFRHLLSLLACAYIRNGMLIVTFASNTSKVLDIRYIKSLKTKQRLGYTYSILKFKFDGKHYKALLPGRANLDIDAELILNRLRKSA